MNAPPQLSIPRLEKMREEIDALDREISGLLLRRFEIASALGKLKHDLGLPVKDSNREHDVLERVATSLADSPLRQHVLNLYERILQESCDAQHS